MSASRRSSYDTRKGKKKRSSAVRSGGVVSALDSMSKGFVLDGTRMHRRALNFRPMGKGNAYHFVRGISQFSSYTATAGFSTGSGVTSFAQDGGTTPVNRFLALAFRLDDLPDYSDFTNLFDNYCILGVYVQLSLRAQPVSQTSGISSSLVVTATDVDDISLPTTYSALKEYTTYREDNGTNKNRIVRQLQPRVAVATYAGSFTSYATPPVTWINTSSQSVQHYGLKIGLPAGNSSSAYAIWDISATYHIACRFGK